MEIQLYEGSRVLEIASRVDELAEMCTTYGWKPVWQPSKNKDLGSSGSWVTKMHPVEGLQKSYIKKQFTMAKHPNNGGVKSGSSLFAMLAVAPGNKIVGYIKGTLYSSYPKLNTNTRVMVIDLLCGQGAAPVKGTGPILLKEAEKYAASVGVNLIILFSVMDAATVRFYRNMGYSRMADACHPDSPINVRARTNGLRKFENLWAETTPKSPNMIAAHQLYRNATQNARTKNYAFYENFNAYHDTVVMSKCVKPGQPSFFGGNQRLSFPAVSEYAQYTNPVSATYKTYARNSSRRLVPQ